MAQKRSQGGVEIDRGGKSLAKCRFRRVAMRLLKMAGIGVAVLVLCSSCTLPAVQKKEFKAKVGADGIQRVEIVGGSYFFNPNHIIVKVNAPVELEFRKEAGIIPHNVALRAPAAGIDFALELTEKPQTVRFTPTRTGTYTFACEKKLLFLESHKEKGMAGTLEVRE
jgi:plastocyanin domain-containing protein